MSDITLLVRNARIVDGTGAPRFAGDVAVKDGLIAAVGTVHGDATQEIDASGRIVGTNIIFALVHSLTPAYALLAAVFGFYLSWLAEAPGSPNLLRPIVTHAVYDYIAVVWIIREYRSRSPEAPG